MKGIEQRPHAHGLRALAALTKENAPTEGGQGVQDNRQVNGTAVLTPAQQANRDAADCVARSIERLIFRGDADLARLLWRTFVEIVMSRDAAYVAKLERQRGLRR